MSSAVQSDKDVTAAARSPEVGPAEAGAFLPQVCQSVTAQS